MKDFKDYFRPRQSKEPIYNSCSPILPLSRPSQMIQLKILVIMDVPDQESQAPDIA